MLDSAKQVIANLLAGNTEYVPNLLYIAYKNVEAPGTVVADPGITDSDNVLEYFSGLGNTADTDYIRAPLTLRPTVTTTSSGTTLEYVVMAPSSGTGISHELPFSVNSNSTVYAVALVCLQDPDMPADAIPLTFSYLAGDAQLMVSGNTTIGFSYNLVL